MPNSGASLTAVAAPANGASITPTNPSVGAGVTIQASSTGTPTAEVYLEATVDGTNWVTLAYITLTPTITMLLALAASNTGYCFVSFRARLASITGGTVSASIAIPQPT